MEHVDRFFSVLSSVATVVGTLLAYLSLRAAGDVAPLDRGVRRRRNMRMSGATLAIAGLAGLIAFGLPKFIPLPVAQAQKPADRLPATPTHQPTPPVESSVSDPPAPQPPQAPPARRRKTTAVDPAATATAEATSPQVSNVSAAVDDRPPKLSLDFEVASYVQATRSIEGSFVVSADRRVRPFVIAPGSGAGVSGFWIKFGDVACTLNRAGLRDLPAVENDVDSMTAVVTDATELPAGVAKTVHFNAGCLSQPDLTAKITYSVQIVAGYIRRGRPAWNSQIFEGSLVTAGEANPRSGRS